MKNTLYLECYAGISGDMTVAALLDLGADAEVLGKALESLPVSGYTTRISRVKKSGLDACDFNVILDADHSNHDHNMDYLHAEEHAHEHGEHSDHVHSHGHESASGHHHEHTHGHEHRGLKEVLEIINKAEISGRAKKLAVRIFNILASAEAKAHGVEIDQVHFHEVGAVDSIVDIVAAAVCIDNLDIDEVIVPVLYEGRGFIRCQHGVIPVPVPAVANIAAGSGLALHITETEGEFVTPTGAAIVAALKTKDKLPEKFSIIKTGLGAGKRNYERPSILRAMLIQGEEGSETHRIIKLESDIDDCTGEALGYVMERLFEAGAKDVNYMPVFMKKNRPAYQINVVCMPEDTEKLEQIIFRETTTIGVRRLQMDRSCLKRTIVTVETSIGNVKVKQCSLNSGVRNYPEYESVAEVCRKNKMSFQDAYHIILSECNAKL